MGATAFTFTNGRWEIDKDKDSQEFFGVNLQDDLGKADTSIKEIEEIEAVGVQIGANPETGQTYFTQGTYAMAFVTGGDPDTGVEGNYVRFRVRYVNGERVDRTIYFAIKET